MAVPYLLVRGDLRLSGGCLHTLNNCPTLAPPQPSQLDISCGQPGRNPALSGPAHVCRLQQLGLPRKRHTGRTAELRAVGSSYDPDMLEVPLAELQELTLRAVCNNGFTPGEAAIIAEVSRGSESTCTPSILPATVVCISV